jgi:hypothetical protein
MNAGFATTVRRAAGLTLAATFAAFACAAGADSGSLLPRTPAPKYAEECGACHLAYPPAFLPAVSWTRVMGGLDKHYGVDASLDARSAATIRRWLEANAGTYKRVAEAPRADRITASAWFERKHRKLAERTWQRPAIRSRANCAACHSGAAQGDYDDDDIRIPG